MRRHGDDAQGDHHRVRAGRLHRGHLRGSRQSGARSCSPGVQAGGQLMLTTWSRTTRGSSTASMGPDLMETFRKQAERFGTEMIADDVTAVDFGARPFASRPATRSYRGAHRHHRHRRLGQAARAAEPSELMGRGVSTCATCDGFFFKDQDIMVVGGGDSALEEALYLSRLGRKVQVVHRRDALRASKIMQERAFKNPKIEFIWDTEVEDVLDPRQGKVTGVRLRNLKTGRGDRAPGRRALRRHRPRAEHRRSSAARSTCIRTATSRSCPAPPRPRSPASSPPATCRTSRLPPGGDRRRHRVHGRARGRALPRGDITPNYSDRRGAQAVACVCTLPSRQRTRRTAFLARFASGALGACSKRSQAAVPGQERRAEPETSAARSGARAQGGAEVAEQGDGREVGEPARAGVLGRDVLDLDASAGRTRPRS